MTLPITSQLDQRLEAGLRRAVDLGEVGLQVAAYLGDELIVDAWIGYQDEPGGRPMDGSTVCPIFSVSKAITATAVHIQAERGLLDYDAPLARYWPEYGSRGKERLPIALPRSPTAPGGWAIRRMHGSARTTHQKRWPSSTARSMRKFWEGRR